jgi:undecaprenyl-diphosphatase
MLLASMLTTIIVLDAIVIDREDLGYRLIDAVQHVDLGPLEPLVIGVDYLTSSNWAIAAWTTLFISLAFVARCWLATLIVGLIPWGGAVNYLIGQAVRRPRPDSERLYRVIAESEATAFPSGHVVGAVLLYGVVFYLAGGARLGWLRAAIRIVAVLVIATVGFARVWLGAHWVSDVLAGYSLGFAMLFALIWLHRRIDAVAGHLPLREALRALRDEWTSAVQRATRNLPFRS